MFQFLRLRRLCLRPRPGRAATGIRRVERAWESAVVGQLARMSIGCRLTRPPDGLFLRSAELSPGIHQRHQNAICFLSPCQTSGKGNRWMHWPLALTGEFRFRQGLSRLRLSEGISLVETAVCLAGDTDGGRNGPLVVVGVEKSRIRWKRHPSHISYVHRNGRYVALSIGAATGAPIKTRCR